MIQPHEETVDPLYSISLRRVFKLMLKIKALISPDAQIRSRRFDWLSVGERSSSNLKTRFSSKSVPMVSVKQTMTKLLGPPYKSLCVNKADTDLKYFDHYTEKHCFYECSVEIIGPTFHQGYPNWVKQWYGRLR